MVKFMWDPIACINIVLFVVLIQIIVADLKRLQLSARDGPSDPYSLAKWRILNRLHDRNETMYYKVSDQVILSPQSSNFFMSYSDEKVASSL